MSHLVESSSQMSSPIMSPTLDTDAVVLMRHTLHPEVVERLGGLPEVSNTVYFPLYRLPVVYGSPWT